MVDEFIKERREEFPREMVDAVPLTLAEIETLEEGGANLQLVQGELVVTLELELGTNRSNAAANHSR